LGIPLFRMLSVLLAWVVKVIGFCSAGELSPISVVSPTPMLIVVWYLGFWFSVAYLTRIAELHIKAQPVRNEPIIDSIIK